jgi:hypothetical protein
VSLRRTQSIEIARTPGEPLMILATLALLRRFHRRLKRALEGS